MKLVVAVEAAEEMRAHARKAYPEECCGLMVGPVPGDFGAEGATVRVESVRRLANAWEGGGRRTRYRFDPLEFSKIERKLAETGRGVLGIYHSHPDVAAWPSPFDLDRAWPSYAYLILSVRDGKPAEERVWRRSEDGRSFYEGVLETARAAVFVK